MPRLLVVVNRKAGGTDDDDVEAALAGLRSGADVTVAATADAAELDDALAARGDRRVVVLGGDGSVNSVLAALDRADALDPGEPIGIIPRGTGNDLARALGLPLDPVEGASVVLSGSPRRLDLLRADSGDVVANAVHAGVGAEAGAAAAGLKRWLGALAYPVGAAVAGVAAPGWRLRVELDGRVAVHETAGWAADGGQEVLMFGVCNGPTIGGGTPLAPDALPDDGLADVVISTATGPAARAAFAVALTTGRHVERPDVLVARSREVSISGPPVALDADGDVGETASSRTWRVQRHAWSVIGPPGRVDRL